MTNVFASRLSLLSQPEALLQLKNCLQGIERESLRVTNQGQLALTEHPKALGSALTHGSITTDYAEPLLEFITQAHAEPAQTLAELEDIHRFTHSVLGDELLWSPSMPCLLPREEDIPIARYGSSNVGQFKYLYRMGLSVRYGRTMQCIAGIHYNFSIPESIWSVLQQDSKNTQPLMDYQSDCYIALIRNFRRYSWLLMYLFGASPAVDKSFLRDNPHQLDTYDEHTLYLPYATSLRMSDLGYQSNAQAGITPCYNNLQNYTDSLLEAVSTPYPAYEAIGTCKDGQWLQINTNILQIENEYYSSIRPKRITEGDERPVEALIKRGIQYVEVRCIDINPFLPLGIDLPQSQFLNSFLLFCALQDSPVFSGNACPETRQNFLTVVNQGRAPDLQLKRDDQAISMQDWATELFDGIQACAELLDQAHGGQEHQQALAQQRAKLADVNLTPSAQVLNAMREKSCSFTQLAFALSRQHADTLRDPAPEIVQHYQALAAQSIEQQLRIEAADSMSFDEYMTAYYAQLN